MNRELTTTSRPLISRLVAGLAMCSLLLFSACFIPAPTETRGWQCLVDADCTPGLLCFEEICRGQCSQVGDASDCQQARFEVCVEKDLGGLTALLCMPECKTGDTRECFPEGTGGSAGVGICLPGTQTCTAQQIFGPCLGATLPKTERCNQIDEDCDGQVDEQLNCNCQPGTQRACYSITDRPGTRNRGECKDGIETCSPSGQYTGQCVGEVIPKQEICDGKDNDCDGQTDEQTNDINKECNVPGIPDSPCRKGISACEQGRLICNQTVQPATEDCNGKDDDCDGSIDNNPLGADYSLTRPCYTGASGCVRDPQTGGFNCQGECRGGAQRCDKDLADWAAACQNEITSQPSDPCNGKDDNCDGSIDNGAMCPSGQTCMNGSCQ